MPFDELLVVLPFPAVARGDMAACAVHASGDLAVEATASLLAEERTDLTGAVAKRIEERAVGRWCARRALVDLGVSDAASIAVPVGPDRAPRWPAGFAGSITHCHLTGGALFAAAVVGPCSTWSSIGVDAEPALAMPEDLLDHIALPAEREVVADLLLADGAFPVDRLLFSAKEAAYKAYAPLGQTVLEFHDVHVQLDIGAGTFEAAFVGDVPSIGVRSVHGSFAVLGAVLVTVTAIPAP